LYIRVIILFLSTLWAQAQYHPLGYPAYLTSSFSESRGTRYHAGLDYGTNMQEGLPVYAPENGRVERVRISPFYYGKALYFKGESGAEYVYAHLSGFSPDIALTAEAKRRAQKTNVLDWRPPLKNSFAFTAGQVLGYSGSTGIGAPHLHFEKRVATKPVNPVQSNKAGVVAGMLDTIAPELKGLVIVQRHRDSALFLSDSVALAQGMFFAPASADSIVGIAIKLVDYSRIPKENPMSVASVQVYCDGTLMYSKAYREQTYGDMRKIGADLLWAEEANTAGDWHNIFNPPMDKNIVTVSPQLSRCMVNPQSKVSIIAKDFANNKSMVSLRALAPDSSHSSLPKPHPHLRHPPQPPLQYQDSLVFSFLSTVWVSTRSCLNPREKLMLYSQSDSLDLCARAHASTSFQSINFAFWANPPDSLWSVVHNKKVQFFAIPALKDTVVLATHPLPMQMYIQDVQPVLPTLLAFTQTYDTTLQQSYLEMHPKGLYFPKNWNACVQGVEDTTFHLYYLGETTRKWWTFSSFQKTGSWRCVSLDEIRDLAIIPDTLAPVLDSIKQGMLPFHGDSVAALAVYIHDNQAGFASGNDIISTDGQGQFIPNEYDPEEGILWIVMDWLPHNKKVSIVLRDEFKNEAKYLVEYIKKSWTWRREY
jgi:hypothetical protein